MIDLTGKAALVTGGSRGIGKAVGLRLARQGADVAFSYRGNTDAAKATAAEIESIGTKALAIQGDVKDPESAEAVVKAVLEAFGKVDILVCAAGVTQKVPTLEMSEVDWTRIIETNLTGTLRSCQVFGREMIKRQAGRVITIASLTSFLGMFQVAAYAASKSGVAGLTRSLAVEWAPHGVTVNAILPGVFKTDLNRALLESPRGQEFLMRTPMRRFGRIDELVGAAVYLASEASSFVTGHLLAVDGGFLASGVNQ